MRLVDRVAVGVAVEASIAVVSHFVDAGAAVAVVASCEGL